MSDRFEVIYMLLYIHFYYINTISALYRFVNNQRLCKMIMSFPFNMFRFNSKNVNTEKKTVYETISRGLETLSTTFSPKSHFCAVVPFILILPSPTICLSKIY